MRLKWAIVGCMMMAGSAAYAETSKPKNILEFLFGAKKAEAPAAISPAPKAAVTAAKAAANKQTRDAQDDGKRRSIRKSKPSPIDPEKRSASAGGSSGSSAGGFRGAGNQAYCVRTCDGFFFPINHEGAQGGDRYATSCQQSCPGAETQVYFMKRGGDIKWSSTARGVSYASLQNALKYRKERDPACSCKSQAQSWGSILATVEPTIRHHKGDLVVTEEISRRIAQGEDALAIAKAAEQQAPKLADATPAKKPDAIGPEYTATAIRSSFGDKITPANKFIKIDPDSTGSITTGKPAAPRPEIKIAPAAAKPEAKAPVPAPAKATAGKATAGKTTAGKTTAGKAGPAKTAEMTAEKADAAKAAGKAAAKAPAKADSKGARNADAAKAAGASDKAKPQKTVLAAAKQATEQRPAAANVDKMALRQTLDRLAAPNKRQ